MRTTRPHRLYLGNLQQAASGRFFSLHRKNGAVFGFMSIPPLSCIAFDERVNLFTRNSSEALARPHSDTHKLTT